MADMLGLLSFLLEDATTRNIFLSGVIAAGPACFMMGARCSGQYVKYLTLKYLDRQEKKKRKRLENALEDGLALSAKGLVLIDRESKVLYCRNCVEIGNLRLSRVILDNDILQCPVCRWRTYISHFDFYI